MLLGVRTYLKFSAGLGLEPRLGDSKSPVLPLDDPAMLIRYLFWPIIANKASSNGVWGR